MAGRSSTITIIWNLGLWFSFSTMDRATLKFSYMTVLRVKFLIADMTTWKPNQLTKMASHRLWKKVWSPLHCYMNFCLLILFIHAATGGRSSSAGKHCLNTPKSGKAQKVVNNFLSNNPFFVMDITSAKLSAKILVKVFLPFFIFSLRFNAAFSPCLPFTS